MSPHRDPRPHADRGGEQDEADSHESANPPLGLTYAHERRSGADIR
jgi:hypothetical protein